MNKSIWKMFGEWIEGHRDAVFTISSVLLIDHFFLGGKFRAKTEELIESLLARAKKSLEPKA